jgi:hypothetical protein
MSQPRVRRRRRRRNSIACARFRNASRRLLLAFSAALVNWACEDLAAGRSDGQGTGRGAAVALKKPKKLRQLIRRLLRSKRLVLKSELRIAEQRILQSDAARRNAAREVARACDRLEEPVPGDVFAVRGIPIGVITGAAKAGQILTVQVGGAGWAWVHREG